MKNILYTLTCVLLVMSLNAQVEMGILLSKWQDQSLPSSSAHDNRYNEVWGYSQDGVEYAIIGTTYGTHFIDVTDPTDIKEVLRVRGGATGSQIIHRDYHDHKGYLYAVADEGAQSTLQIIDLSKLPDTVDIVYDSKELIRRSHNIFIDADNDRLYSLISAGETLNFSPMRVFDIQDPTNPVLIGSYNFIEGFGLGGGAVHDAFVKDNIAYLNCGYSGFVVADMTNLDSVALIASLSPNDYPFSGYNHSGWLSEDGGYYYMSDENHGFDMKVVDVRNLPDIRIERTFNAGSSSVFSIPHNQVVNGDYLYVSYYFDGLQVYDISDPSGPQQIMHYPTSSRDHANGLYQGAWGVYPFLPSGNILVSDMQEGLFVIAPVGTSTDVVDQFDSGVQIYPNPIQSAFNIDGINSSDVKVNLFNSVGQLVQQWKGDQSSYVLDQTILNGQYIIQVETESSVKSYNINISR